MNLVSSQSVFEGRLNRYSHHSEVLNCDMVFAVFLPPNADDHPVPLLWWLSGLTCTDENFMQKAGAMKMAAQLGMAIVCPDTSPRGTNLPGEHESYDLGSGAGFYVNASQEPWSAHYRMYDYITLELPELLNENLPINGKHSISGHSMGGHGPLICALKNPGKYQSAITGLNGMPLN
jgi:S-formylglutathione hydrolase